MVGKIQKGLILTLILLMSAVNLPAQQKAQEDSVVYLMKATSVQLIEKYGRAYRKSVDATFLHNGTYLICDTALWDVDRKVIKAEGHVKVIQGDTELTSETLDYIIDEDLAKFRGGVVQLRNKQNNILRTRHLDYNTKDSIAVFKSGGSMKDADGQVIESMDGTYESARKMFTFDKNVNMYTDTTFVKTTKMTYDSGCNKANFTAPIDFWKDDNMLSAGCGWYDRVAELFFFRQRVHGMTPDQEVWCDTLYYHRDINDVLMLGNVQAQDSSRNVAGLADYMYYCDSLDQITMRKRAAVAIETEQNGQIDTLYFGADTLIYRTIPRCDVPAYETDAAKARMDDMMLDPVQEFRRKAAEAARKAAEEAAMNDLNAAGKLKAAEAAKKAAAGADAAADSISADAAPPEDAVTPAAETSPASTDSLVSNTDSLAPAIDSLPSILDSIPSLKDSIPTAIDTLKARLDSIALADSLARADSLHVLDSLANRDTTKIGFLEGIHNVKMFRTDMQVRCDSLRYTDLDSIARFYINPIVWNDGNRQYTSDSLSVLIKDGGVERASLMSNALILTQEDTCYYDQIKGTDVMAYFDSTSTLRRFDALGGASALFFLQENDTYATVNKVESKMLSALMVDGELDRVFYFESPKNDAYPIAQMKSEDLKMKGFNWNPEARPTGPWDITTLKVKPLERKQYSRRAKPVFKQTDIYFPGYMDKVYKELEDRKNKPKSRPASDSLPAGPDSLAVPADSTLSVADSLSSASLAAADSLASATLSASADSLAAVGDVDSTAVTASPTDPRLLKAQQRKEKQEAREEARKLRIAARDARWAELDARDAAKAEAKKQKELARKRAKTKKLYLKQSEQDSIDEARLQKYIERYEKQKAAHERKQQSVAARKRASRIEERGDIPPAPES